MKGGLPWAALALGLAACTSVPAPPPGWQSAVVTGQGFAHWIATPRTPAAGDCLTVFIEGDGSPWIGRQRIAADPTPNNPVLLRIAAHLPGPALYLGRPCYFGLARSPGCTADDWTFGRYAERVVDSMVAATRAQRARQPEVKRIALVGHSGGGTLAVLMAARLPETRAVVTLAAPLDLDAWARLHHYTPLAGSLDPARQPPLPHTVAQRHFTGSRDDNVPAAANRNYFERNPNASVQQIDGMTHSLGESGEAVWAQRVARALADAGCGAYPER